MTMHRPRRIVLATFGSLGDLHPFMAIAQELQKRGHVPIIATSAYYRNTIQNAGIDFGELPPDYGDFQNVEAIVRKILYARNAPELLVRQVMMPHLRACYRALDQLLSDADLLVCHPLIFAGPLIAQKRSIPWASAILAPASFFTIYDPPILAPMPYLHRIAGRQPWVWRILYAEARRRIRCWSRPLTQLRKELGLPATSTAPLMDGQYSPYLNLALFPGVMMQPQPDWPANTVVTGIAEYDGHNEDTAELDRLNAFLDAGSAPVVFTLGSAGVVDPRAFYSEGVKAVMQMGLRAVLLIGAEVRQTLPITLPDTIGVFGYAPYNELFPRACALVRSCGIGTTANALRSGKPSLMAPFGFDQPDNAARCERLGVGITLPRRAHSSAVLQAGLHRLLDDPAVTRTCEAIANQVCAENGAQTACDAILGLLQG